MDRSLSRVGVIAACSMLAGAANAQDVTSSPKDVALGWAKPFAVVSVQGAFGSPNEILGLYLYWTRQRDDGGKKGFAVRRATENVTIGTAVEWASSFDCPNLEATIINLEALAMPLIDVPTIGRDDRQGPSTDGVTYSLWSRWPTWPNGFGYSVEVASNVRTPLAEWAESIRTVLGACWSNDEPLAAGRGS